MLHFSVLLYNMKRTDRINEVISLIQINRKTGQSGLLFDIAKENDVFIITHKKYDSNLFEPCIREKIVSINSLKNIRGARKKIILFDNVAILELMSDFEPIVNENRTLSNKLTEAKNELSEANKRVKMFENSFGYRIYVTICKFFRITNKYNTTYYAEYRRTNTTKKGDITHL